MTEPADISPTAPNTSYRVFSGLLLCIAAGLGLAAILNAEPLLSANDRSRWATIWSLGVRDSYQIDEIIANEPWDTIDKVRHEDHFYSTKPPLFPTMVSWLYRGIRGVTGWRFEGDDVGLEEPPRSANTLAVTRTILILVNLVPMLLALGVLAWWFPRVSHNHIASGVALAGIAFGTFLSPYLVTLNNHTVAAYCVIFSVVAVSRIVCEGQQSPWLFAAAGFFAASACTNELPAALWGVITFLLLVKTSPKQTALFYVPAALIPLIGFFWTNYLATGGYKPFYAYYGTEKYEYIFQGVPSYWMNPRGIDANQESPLVYFFHCTFGHHGIFSLTPLFVLTLWSWLDVRTWKAHRFAVIHAVGIGLTAAVMGFYLTRTANYNYGGNTAGLRWVFWLIPFWIVAMLPLLEKFSNRAWFWGLTSILLLGSIASATSAVGNPWRPSWLYNIMKKWEWIDYDTQPPELPRKLTTFFSSLPEVDEANPAWIEFSSVDADGRRTKLLLMDGGWRTPQRKIRKLIVRWTSPGEPERVENYWIDQAKFEAGEYPKNFLIWPGDSTGSKDNAYAFFQNMPRAKPYNNDHIRYVKTVLRPEEAFRCQQAAAQVSGPHGLINFRSDVWICDQVPFGVVRFQSLMRDRATGDWVGFRRFDVSNASWYFKVSPSAAD